MSYIMVDENSRLTAWAAPGFHCGTQEFEAEMPESFEPGKLRDYVYRNGMVMYDPLPDVQPEVGASTEERLAVLEEENRYLKETLELILNGETDEE